MNQRADSWKKNLVAIEARTLISKPVGFLSHTQGCNSDAARSRARFDQKPRASALERKPELNLYARSRQRPFAKNSLTWVRRAPENKTSPALAADFLAFR